MKKTLELSACIDCYQYSALGSFRPDSTPESEEKIVNGFIDISIEYGVDPMGCAGELENEFTNQPCQICDSKLAGERHQIIFLG
tara:strand:+ start:60 stop:311 length:252 start_codon:yes stop_codon:yes gene_type:complete